MTSIFEKIKSIMSEFQDDRVHVNAENLTRLEIELRLNDEAAQNCCTMKQNFEEKSKKIRHAVRSFEDQILSESPLARIRVGIGFEIFNSNPKSDAGLLLRLPSSACKTWDRIRSILNLIVGTEIKLSDYRVFDLDKQVGLVLNDTTVLNPGENQVFCLNLA